MNKIYIIYWSQTGNTQQMAEAVAEGVKKAGKQAELLEVASASYDVLKEAAVFALGCPAMGDEVLEESEMEPFVSQLESFVDGKTVALFGSYGWGDGQWMRDWVERMEKAGAKVLGGEELICCDAPDADMVNKCQETGEQLARQA